VNQGGGVQRAVARLAAELAVGDASQLIVKHSEQAIEGFPAAAAGRPQQLGYCPGVWHCT
jgi:hypothetical protein